MDHVISALAGGALIGLAASLLLLASGRVAGVSGMVSGLLPPQRGEWAYRLWFLAGLFGSGVVAMQLAPESIGASPRGLIWLAIAGLLVGAGTRLSGGCTSGHGVCGISRFASRSIVATLVFIACGMLTASLFGARS
jgi:uncharacterized membrane protein YedE/YeeE